MYKKSLFWLPCVQGNFRFLMQESIVIGISRFFFGEDRKFDKVLK